MPLIQEFKLFQEYGILDKHPHGRLALKNDLVAMARSEKPPKFSKLTNDPIEQNLYVKLFRRYPDLKFVPNTYSSYDFEASKEYAQMFIKYQIKLMKDGYSEKKSFELAEDRYKARMKEKIYHSKICNNLAISNNARSLMTFYQQEAEYEARLKVKRLRRDLHSYKKAKTEFQKKLDLLKDQIDKNEEIGDIEEYFGNNFPLEAESIYERIQTPIIQSKTEADYFYSKQENVDNFFEKTLNTFNYFYKRAAALDRLSGLTDPEIINIANQAPTYIKRTKKRLLRKLEKYNVTLKPNGDVDFSNCIDKSFKEKYQNDPTIKLALLEKATDFGHEHHYEYKKDLMALEKRLNEISKTNSFEQRDIDELSEILVSESPELRKEILERLTSFNLDPLKKEEAEAFFRESLGRKAKIEKDNQTETILQTIKDIFSEQIVDESSSNKLIETYTERIRRIEITWIKNRIAKLETSESNIDLISNALKQLKHVANDFRRLKFLLDQKALIDAKQLYFEEHAVFSKEEMLIDEKIQFELLFDYLKIPESQRTLSENEKYFDNKIVDLIGQKPLTYDIIKPFQEHERNHFKMRELNSDSNEETFYADEIEFGKINNDIDDFENEYGDENENFINRNSKNREDNSDEEF